MLDSFFKTGIKELDKILGAESISSQNVVLIKGGPGSGKTILGLQIINEHLKEKTHNGGFISLEVDNKRIVEYTKQHFGFSNLDKDAFYFTSSNNFKKILKDHFNPDKGHFRLAKAIAKSLKNSKEENFKNDNNVKTILFFDSLNILIDTIQSNIENKMSKREIIKEICMIKNEIHEDDGDELLKNTVFIFSVEYHPSLNEYNSLISESFLCDTEILLNIEPVLGITEKPVSDISSIGYKIEADKNGKKANELRSFCRVLKTRFGNHESRRCSYDIVEEEGLKFYGTYPGDGQVCLFYENEKQKEAWESFFNDDIPHQFPSLRYEAFNRKYLQQNFSTQRRLRYVPKKTDLYLGSFDNYWIHWYTDVYRRQMIQEIIRNKSILAKKYIEKNKTITNQDAEKPELLINEIHTILVNRLIGFGEHKIIEPFKDIKEKALKNFFIKNTTNDIKISFLFNNKVDLEQIEIGIQNLSGQISPFGQYKIERKATCIHNITSLCFIEKGKRNKINYEPSICDLYIVGNSEGLIIFVYKQSENTKIILNNIFFANYSHHRIEFTTKDNEVIIYDNIYNITYMDRYDNTKSGDIKELPLNNVVVDDSDGIFISIEFYLDNLKVINVKNEKYSIYINKFLEKFIEDDINDFVNILINIISSNESKKCLECNNIRRLLDGLKDSIYLKCVLNCFENYKKSSSLLTSFKDFMKEQYLNIDKTKDNSSHLYDEAIYSMLLELTNSKYFQCKGEEYVSLLQKNGCNLEPSLFNYDYKNCGWKIKIEKEINDFGTKHNFEVDVIEQLVQTISKRFNDTLLNALPISALTEKFEGIFKKEDLTIDNTAILTDISNIYMSLLKNKESKGFFVAIDEDELRLFGEKKSKIIKELSKSQYEDNRPVHHEDILFSMHNYNKYLSIPYDANIGIFIYKKNILTKFYESLKKDDMKRVKYENMILEIYTKEMELVNSLIIIDNPIIEYSELTDKIKKLVNQSIYDIYPKTWEEIISIFLIENGKYEFAIETQAYDTYLSTFLEILWNCGGNLYIKPDYEIVNYDNNGKGFLYQAFYLLAYMYHIGLISKDSTLEPEEFSERYKRNDKEQYNSRTNTPSGENNRDWLFMRHWYSTFVELLTAKKQTSEASSNKYIWKLQKDSELGLMPMPVSLSKYLKVKNPYDVEHCSCWGDWHLGILKGSENINLGIELINSLMSSQKITDRAFNNAALPTTESFYTLYKNASCFNIPDHSDRKISNITYQELRNMYFKHAKSRSQIFDYRHCMREIHSILKYVEQLPLRDKCKKDFENIPKSLPEFYFRDIVHQIDNAIKAIDKFKGKDLLSH